MLRVAAIVVVLGAVAALAPPADAHGGPSTLGAAHRRTGLDPIAGVHPATAGGWVEYIHPVDAEVVDSFRPPATRYGPGNRGLKYQTEPGSEILAAADGVVVFAGQVGGALHVTVAHPDGRLTSYSGVAAIEVRRFEEVAAGQVIARSAGLLHVGVRENGAYIDPASIFGQRVAGARLIPESPVGGSGWAAGLEFQELAAIARDLGIDPGVLARIGGFVGRVGGAAGAIVDAGLSTFEVHLELARSGWRLVVDHGPLVLALAWRVAPFLLARSHPVVAGVLFLVVIPLATGEVPPVLHFAGDMFMFTPRVLGRTVEWWIRRQHCTPAGTTPPVPAGRRVAVLVGGLDSTSDHAAIGRLATDELGYEPGMVVGFSYAGGRTPGSFAGVSTDLTPELGGLAVNDYGRTDSSRDLARRGELLADLLSDVAQRLPDAHIDVYGHSQGGVVARHALQVLEHREGGPEVIDRLGLVATIASPHQGADLAAMSEAISGSLVGSATLWVADSVSGSTLHPRGTNLSLLSPGSDHLTRLAGSGLPDGPHYLSIGSRGDLAVTEARSRLPGARHATVPGFGPSIHSDVLDQPGTTRELALGLAGLPPTCESLWEFLGDVAVSEAVQFGSSATGLLASLTALPIAPHDILEPFVGW
jgi:hypothetical protein